MVNRGENIAVTGLLCGLYVLLIVYNMAHCHQVL